MRRLQPRLFSLGVSPSRLDAAVVLAAGEGTRMRSATPKVLHEVGGRTLVGHVLAAVRRLDPAELLVVVGHGREAVEACVAAADPGSRCVVQPQQDGTGHAVRLALEALPGLRGTVLVVSGDTPLLRPETLAALAEAHAGNAATVLSAVVPDPTGYGRILRAPDGAVAGIVEEKDATDEQRRTGEVNSGVYAFDADHLREALVRLTRDNAQGEEYLTDVLGILVAAGERVGVVRVADHREVVGVNDRVQLAAAGALLRDRTLAAWMAAGVTVVDPATTWVDADVELAPDVVLLPGTRLHGRTRVAEGAEIGPDTTLRDCEVGTGARVRTSTCDEATIGSRAAVGPYAYLRPGTVLSADTKAGAFVEMKNARVGENSKVPHLTYVGDADIGRDTNIGCATVFVNYDGQDKHRSTVGDGARIGSDTMVVAPVTIGDGAYTAAGSVITSDVPPGALAVARGKQRNIEGWVGRRRPGTVSAQAAEQAAVRGRADGERGDEP